MSNEIKIHASVGVVVAKATAFCSIMEFDSKNLPPLEWILEVESAGIDCPSVIDENGNTLKGNIILEYADKFKHIITTGDLTWNKQVRYYKENKIKMVSGTKIKIEEYMLVPHYNIMAIVERDVIMPEHTTIYEMHNKIKNEAPTIILPINDTIGKA
jgi:hypothetical protein